LAENLLNDIFKLAKVKADEKNGRYLCKIRIQGIYRLKVEKNKFSGWIYYQMFFTTKDMEKMKKGFTLNDLH